MRSILLLGLSFTGVGTAADFPQAEISNGQIRAKLYLPDAKDGFYKSTRFDWSGVISSLVFGGHDYYGPWFTTGDPTVRDFVYRDADIVVSPESGSMGPADEFQTPLGFDAAPAGGTFIKIGVGVLRRPDAAAYSAFAKYELVNPGEWSITKHADSIEFTQVLDDSSLGYGYVYTKTVRLTPGKPEMTIGHSLKNTGRQAIRSNVYNHNFLVLDKTATGPDYVITMSYVVKTSRPPSKELAEVTGRQIVYLKPLEGKDTVYMPVEGFGGSAKDYDIRVENRRIGAGMRIMGDQPLASVSLWSIRSVLAIEPFVAIQVDPGKDMVWKCTYTYYNVQKAN